MSVKPVKIAYVSILWLCGGFLMGYHHIYCGNYVRWAMCLTTFGMMRGWFDFRNVTEYVAQANRMRNGSGAERGLDRLVKRKRDSWLLVATLCVAMWYNQLLRWITRLFKEGRNNNEYSTFVLRILESLLQPLVTASAVVIVHSAEEGHLVKKQVTYGASCVVGLIIESIKYMAPPLVYRICKVLFWFLYIIACAFIIQKDRTYKPQDCISKPLQVLCILISLLWVLGLGSVLYWSTEVPVAIYGSKIYWRPLRIVAADMWNISRNNNDNVSEISVDILLGRGHHLGTKIEESTIKEIRKALEGNGRMVGPIDTERIELYRDRFFQNQVNDYIK